MGNTKPHILLADDDVDDCDFFRDALDELGDPYELTIINNGVVLMEFLGSEPENYPTIIFLDLNMPKKSGMECILEIKASDVLSKIPIIVYSTSLDKSVVDAIYDMGASHYIQKPAEFSSIKSVIKKALTLSGPHHISNSHSREYFIIQP